MTRIFRTHYRYKRPPRKRKAVALEVPAVVAISDKTRKRVAKDQLSPAPRTEMPADDTTALPQLQRAIVTARRPRTIMLAPT